MALHALSPGNPTNTNSAYNKTLTGSIALLAPMIYFPAFGPAFGVRMVGADEAA